MNENRHRSRALYALYILTIVCLGLISRSGQSPYFVKAYVGDILWATAAFLFIGFLAPKMTTRRAAVCAAAFSFLIELSQLYHTPWLDGLRRTGAGALALGRGFLWSDLACYVVGVACGVCVDLIASRSRSRSANN